MIEQKMCIENAVDSRLFNGDVFTTEVVYGEDGRECWFRMDLEEDSGDTFEDTVLHWPGQTKATAENQHLLSWSTGQPKSVK
jgi:hypothetical protein